VLRTEALGAGVESTPRPERSPGQHLGRKRRSSQHLDRSGVRVNTSDRNGARVNTSDGGSRVNTSTGTESESTPRVEADVESTPRPERSPSQHLGWRKSSQHLDWSGIRVNTSDGSGRRVNTSTGTEPESTPRVAEVESTPRQERSPDFESAPRNVGGVVFGSRVSSSSAWDREWSRLPKFAGLYTPERPIVRPGSACGARLFAR